MKQNFLQFVENLVKKMLTFKMKFPVVWYIFSFYVRLCAHCQPKVHDVCFCVM